MTLPISIQYKGDITGTLDERKETLREKFNDITKILERHNVQLTPDSISAAGQIVGATIDANDFDSFAQELAATGYDVRHDPNVRVLV